MSSGWITVNRDIRDSWIWDKSPVKSYFEAWIDMLMSASIKDNKQVINGQMVKTERGQLAWSLRFMGERWGWSKNKAANFLKLLRSEQMIITNQNRDSRGTVKGTLPPIITICNYRKYQDIKSKSGTANKPKQGQSRDSRGTVEGQIEQVNNITIDQKTCSISDEIPRQPIPKSYNEDFIRCWQKYPKRSPNNSKQKASIAFNARIKSGVPLADLEAGLDRYIQYCQQAEILNTSFVKLAATFFGPGEDWKEDWILPKKKLTGSAATQERNRLATEKMNENIQEIRNERAKITSPRSDGLRLEASNPYLR